MAELNELLAGRDDKDEHRRISNRPQTVGHDGALERASLRPLPAEPFPTWLTVTPRVDRYARVTVRQCLYSVPAKLIGRLVRVLLRRLRGAIFDDGVRSRQHERVTARGGQSLILDHYLEVLLRKPGALPGATALAQARAAGTFTAAHDAFWAMCRRQARRRCRHPSPGRGAAAAPPPARDDVDRRDDRRVAADVGRQRTWSRSRPAKPTAGPDPGPAPVQLLLKRRTTPPDSPSR